MYTLYAHLISLHAQSSRVIKSSMLPRDVEILNIWALHHSAVKWQLPKEFPRVTQVSREEKAREKQRARVHLAEIAASTSPSCSNGIAKKRLWKCESMWELLQAYQTAHPRKQPSPPLLEVSWGTVNTWTPVRLETVSAADAGFVGPHLRQSICNSFRLRTWRYLWQSASGCRCESLVTGCHKQNDQNVQPLTSQF